MTRCRLVMLILSICFTSLLLYWITISSQTTELLIKKNSIQFFAYTNVSDSSQSKTGCQPVCCNISISEAVCKSVKVNKDKSPTEFPLQFVSGSPGSGNDWILWLASLNSDYTCEIYGKLQRTHHLWIGENSTKFSNTMNKMKRETSTCLFLKTHEPWYAKNPLAYNSSVRATLLLRHPYDAAVAEYKRRLVSQQSSNNTKLSIEGVTIDKFFNPRTNSTNPAYLKYLTSYATSWSHHMHYWLEAYNGSLHVMIYNNVRADTGREIEEMQRFFGYRFNDASLRDHCCKMRYPYNKILKRKRSDVDAYKERIFQSLGGVRQKLEAIVKKTNVLLSERYPNQGLMLDRG
ncbi:WSCD family member CG9164-like [Watersipora subatra]|uniref:WSCD family member CG9164-like n=1 Tax=Watersipora subatra TaxID=2589382 RepID=UPI00355B815B